MKMLFKRSHMNAFAEAPHRDRFLETFLVTNFQVLGDTNEELKTKIWQHIQMIIELSLMVLRYSKSKIL